MARTMFRAGARGGAAAAACSVMLSVLAVNSAFAQTSAATDNDSRSATHSRTANGPIGEAAPSRVTHATAPVQDRAHRDVRKVQQTGYHAGVVAHHPGPVPAPLYLPPNAPPIIPCGYPSLNAPLYPCPLPNIPYQTGGTFITNQAFDPHEMLYPHTYRSIYPPYYYEVHGGWKTFPWGVWQSEQWRLRGTLVTVKYHSSIGLFSGYVPPALNSLNVVRPHHWEHRDCNY